MNYSLEFPYRYSYESHTPITLPIVLLSDLLRSVDIIAAADTGSTFSIFERSYGEALGLSVESGSREFAAIPAVNRFVLGVAIFTSAVLSGREVASIRARNLSRRLSSVVNFVQHGVKACQRRRHQK